MEKLFLKRKGVELNSLYDMMAEDGGWADSGIQNYSVDSKGSSKVRSKENKVNSIDKSKRSSMVKKGLKVRDYPDICNSLLQMINIWDATLDPSKYYVNQFDYLKYGVNDHFHKHRDQWTSDEVDKDTRLFSTSTIIAMSDDLEGGDFVIYDEQDNPTVTSLEVGDTIFFESDRWHKVTPVTKGERIVLVAWMGFKTNKIFKKQDLTNHK